MSWLAILSELIVNVKVPFSLRLMSLTLIVAVSLFWMVAVPEPSPMTTRVASVAPLNFASDRLTVNVKLQVNITGVVGSPGHYLFDPTTTVVDALAQAGGTGLEFTIANNAAADLEHARMVRDGETIFLDLRPESPDLSVIEMRIQSGDWIHVPPKERSRLRDDITFWSGVLSLVASVAAMVVLVGG